MGKKATIKDVAKAAGVSISTVSYTISGKRSISSEVRKLIFEKIQEMDYRPNLFACSMRSNETRRIGIVMDEFTNPHSSLLLQAIADKIRQSSYKVVFASAGLNVEDGRSELYSFSTGLVDGILNMLPQIDPGEAELICGSVPVYTFMRDPYAPFDIDFNQVVRNAIDRFIELGHTRIGYLAPTFRMYQGKDSSVETFMEYMKQRGLAVSPDQIICEEDTINGGERAMAKLSENHSVSAVLTGNDLMALGVYRWAGKHNLSVPKDLSVIGCDDISLAELVTPALSTFRHPVQGSADFTVRMLLEKIAGAKTPHPVFLQTIPYIERDSVAQYQQHNKERKKR